MNMDTKSSQVSVYERLIGIWTILFVYVIGLYYAFVEFVKDNLWILRRHSAYSQKLESEIASSKFLRDNLSKQSACAVVTGASGTIGIEIVRALLKLGFRVEALSDEEGDLLTLEDTGHLNTHIFDISDFEKVKVTADEIRTASPNGISLVVCNAGVMLHPYKVNRWGYEHHMAVNLLSHALLVDRLLPRSSDIEAFHHQSRIVFVSSSTAHAGYIDQKVLLSSEDLFNRYINGYQAYADSKLLVAFYAEQLQRYLLEQYSDRSGGDNNGEIDGIKVCSVHPGCVPGGLYKYTNYPFRVFANRILPLFVRNASISAHEVLATVFSDNLKGGSYYEYMEPVRLKVEIPHTIRQKVFDLVRQAIKI